MRTVLHIDNLHCQSCVADIQACFSMLNANSGLDVSFIDQTVSFDFPDITAVVKELERRGFNVTSTLPTRTLRSFLASVTYTTARSGNEARHKEICAACRDDISLENKSIEDDGQEILESIFTLEGSVCSACTSTLSNLFQPRPGIQSSHITVIPPAAIIQHDRTTVSVATILQLIKDSGYDATLVSSKPLQSYEGIFSIGGMTCTACVSAVTRAMESVPGVTNTRINLIGNSGSAIVRSRGDVDRVRDEIENAGFDCSIVETIPQHSKGKPKASTRKVTISTEGKIEESALRVTLSSLPFHISYSFSLYSSPAIFTLTYVPRPPMQTLRTILDLLKHSHPSVTFTPLPPRSLSSTSQKASNYILRLFLITLVFAIPTFVVAVVGMSLLPATNSFRMSLEKPVWGDATLATIILCGLATPIQLGIGAYFYMGAAASIWSVWRSSSTSWVNRLIRWGSMDTLIALGTSTGYVTSLVILGLDVSGKGMGESGVGGMGWFDSSVFLMLFILLGRHLDHLTKQRTTSVLTALSGSVPEGGLLMSSASPVTSESSNDPLKATTPSYISTPLFEMSDIILIPPGSSPPLDCTLIAQPPSSSSKLTFSVDTSRPLTHFIQASLTGEHSPVPKFEGDPIYAGTVNAGNSAVLAKVECLEGDRVVDGILNMALGSDGGKGRGGGVERIAESITSWFVPALVGVACVVFVAWCFRGIPTSLRTMETEMTAGGRVLFAVQFAVAVLVVACPCGIGLAAPTAQMVGIGLGAQHGIVSNGGGGAFFALSNLNTLVMDKTGTITRGKFTVADISNSSSQITSTPSHSPARALVLSLLRSAEFASTHPVAVGIREWCGSQLQLDTDQSEATNVELVSSEEIPGRGLLATLRISAAATDLEVCIGNENLMQDVHAEYTSPILAEQSSRDLRSWQIGGKSVVLLSVKLLSGSSFNLPIKAEHHTILALLGVHDPPRAEASTLITELRKLNIDVWMISGDNELTAKTIAQSVGIESTHVIAGALPADKQSWVERLQNGEDISLPKSPTSSVRERKTVAFVGDGINDAPALSQADIGLAMGSGSSLALSTASFTLLRSDLLSILTIYHLARITRRRIISNFVWASLYNVALIPLAGGAFYGISGKRITLPPVWASAAMALSSISVVVNSLALRWTYKEPDIVRSWTRNERSEA
ncbi:hypothetical protein BU17DRAFT_53888 [Hysterangium stoloniferum]|nr:hypothetical protein BU17DRAFT_53888 [Hysterangium stoloniferum]